MSRRERETRHSPPLDVTRCPWPTAGSALYLAYHDQEWGVPVHHDRKIFEFLVLEAFQAGLSWRTFLYKRKNFRKAFAGFDYRTLARFGRRDVARLLKDEGIVRNPGAVTRRRKRQARHPA